MVLDARDIANSSTFWSVNCEDAGDITSCATCMG